jgi:tetratricopeptide (TPR) repeat protein
VNHRRGIVVELAFALGLLVPMALAQKPPAPSPTPSRPASPPRTSTQPSQPGEDRVMFLQGQVKTNDGTPVPNDMAIERICNNNVRQRVYTSFHGDFNMELGSRGDSVLEASDEPSSLSGAASKDSTMGIPRRNLANCELRATAAGFRSNIVSLAELTAFGNSSNDVIDVGAIVVRRTAKIEGTTLSAVPYKAPKDALRAYEKGLEAEKKADLASAHKHFEAAVQIYPQYVSAWYQLGRVLRKESQKDAAIKAYKQATNIDSTYLPPYMALAVMAFEAENWREVLRVTGHILDLDPLNTENVKGYIVDLDPLNSSQAYFYNAVANFKLNNIEAAEKSALKAENDLRTRSPQLHLLLAEIYTRKGDYAGAISAIQTYLGLAPHAKDADQAREELARLEKLNGSVATSESSDKK